MSPLGNKEVFLVIGDDDRMLGGWGWSCDHR
jgi:hypothetical protein